MGAGGSNLQASVQVGGKQLGAACTPGPGPGTITCEQKSAPELGAPRYSCNLIDTSAPNLGPYSYHCTGLDNGINLACQPGNPATCKPLKAPTKPNLTFTNNGTGNTLSWYGENEWGGLSYSLIRSDKGNAIYTITPTSSGLITYHDNSRKPPGQYYYYIWVRGPSGEVKSNVITVQSGEQYDDNFDSQNRTMNGAANGSLSPSAMLSGTIPSTAATCYPSSSRLNSSTATGSYQPSRQDQSMPSRQDQPGQYRQDQPGQYRQDQPGQYRQDQTGTYRSPGGAVQEGFTPRASIVLATPICGISRAGQPQIVLNWSVNNASDILRYSVQRTDGNNVTQLIANGLTNANYVDTQLTTGPYTYIIIGVSGGMQIPSNPVNYDPAASCFNSGGGSPAVTARWDNGVILTWTALDNNTYVVTRQHQDGTVRNLTRTTGTNYTDTSAAANTNYVYYVRTDTSPQNYVGSASITTPTGNSGGRTGTGSLVITNVETSGNSFTVTWSPLFNPAIYTVSAAPNYSSPLKIYGTTTASSLTFTPMSNQEARVIVVSTIINNVPVATSISNDTALQPGSNGTISPSVIHVTHINGSISNTATSMTQDVTLSWNNVGPTVYFIWAGHLDSNAHPLSVVNNNNYSTQLTGDTTTTFHVTTTVATQTAAGSIIICIPFRNPCAPNTTTDVIGGGSGIDWRYIVAGVILLIVIVLVIWLAIMVTRDKERKEEKRVITQRVEYITVPNPV